MHGRSLRASVPPLSDLVSDSVVEKLGVTGRAKGNVTRLHQMRRYMIIPRRSDEQTLAKLPQVNADKVRIASDAR